MKKLFAFITIALLLFQLQLVEITAQVSQPSQKQTADKYADKLRAFEDFVRQWMEKNKAPGLTIGFIKDDYVWVKGFGYADLENKTPAKAESAYRLASLQKSMTAIAVLQLVEQGKINLDAEIQTYVPYFPKKKYPITVRQLLGHLGGMPHYVNRSLEQHIKEHKTTREAVAIFENFDLVAEPGTKYSYSTYGYILLGAAIEGASKQSYADYMREHIWKPLTMNDTRMDDPLAIIPNRVRGYQLVKGEVRNSEFIDVSSRFSAGGTRGTVVDLLRLLKGVNSGKLLSKENTSLMYTPMKTRDGQPIAYAMGWQIQPFKNRRSIVVNDGGQQETRTFMLNFPEKNFAIAFAMNLEADIYAPLINQLYELVLDEKLVIDKP